MADKKKHDAIQFLEINENTQTVRAIDKYRIGVSAKLPDWLNVKEVIEGNDLRAGTTLNSVNAIACIYRYINSSKNEQRVQEKKMQMFNAIKVLNNTVGVSKITNVSLQAMCIIIREYVDTNATTVDLLIDKFSKVNLDSMISSAITMKNNGTRKNVVSYLAFLLVQEYNSHVRKGEIKLSYNNLEDK